MKNFTILFITLMIAAIVIWSYRLDQTPPSSQLAVTFYSLLGGLALIALLNQNFQKQDPPQDKEDPNRKDPDWLSYMLFGK
jgi:hypothetical protein